MKRLIVRIGLGIVMGGLLWGGLPANQARAADVTFNFTGLVNTVNGTFPTPSGFDTGTILSGSYTFNNPSTSSDANGSSSVGLYNNQITNVTFSLGGYSNTSGIGSSSPNFIRVGDNVSDSYLVAAPVLGDPVGGRTPTSIVFDLFNGSASQFGDDTLPITPPNVNAFALHQFRVLFDFGDGSGGATVIGTLSPLTAVPLPAAVILFGAGLIALVSLGAGSWRKRNNSLA